MVGIVLASHEEYERVRPAMEMLERLGCPYETIIASVWAAPERLLSWAERAEHQGLRVIIATAGAEPQLPGFIAAASHLPVIALPLGTGYGDEAQSLRLALRTSPAAPVAAVEPEGTEQAALLAIRILAGVDPGLGEALEAYRQSLVIAMDAQTRKVQAEGSGGVASQESPGRRGAAGAERAEREREPDYEEEEEGRVEIRPANFDRPLTGQPVRAPEPTPRPPTPPPPLPARSLGRRKIDPDAPDYEIIEEAVDCLLEGGLIAFPTDTVYGVAADATNPAAVARLYELKGRPRNKAIALLVDSPKLLSGIACNLTVETRRLMEAFWPGPLTIIFQKRGGNFTHVSNRDTIGVRLPDHSVPLAIMQALSRPLACTSANLAGLPEALTADEVEDAFPDQLNLILDCGPLPDSPPSTVIDVTREPFTVLRFGAVTHTQLAAIVGDKLEAES